MQMNRKPPLTSQQKSILFCFLMFVLAANVLVFMGVVGSSLNKQNRSSTTVGDSPSP